MSLKFRLVKFIKLALHFYLTPNLRSNFIDLVSFFLFYRCIYHKFGVFHKAILSSFILIFALFALSGCGYKDDPFYGDAPVKEKKTDKINKI